MYRDREQSLDGNLVGAFDPGRGFRALGGSRSARRLTSASTMSCRFCRSRAAWIDDATWPAKVPNALRWKSE
jgi:hypothetical protein